MATPEQFAIDISKWIAEAKTKGQEFCSAFALELFDELRQVTPVVTGNLRNSWMIGLNNQTSQFSAEAFQLGDTIYIFNRAKYAMDVEYGTRPHDIVPVNAKVLYWRAGGSDHYAMKVHHPGFEGRGFTRETVARADAIAQEIADRIGSE